MLPSNPYNHFGLIYICFALMGLAACVPPSGSTDLGGRIDLEDESTQRIYELQNQRNTDSLLLYLESPNPHHRYLAARSLASFPELGTRVSAALSGALRDTFPPARIAAAYALGQTGSPTAASHLTEAYDTSGSDAAFMVEILAAVGKTGDEELQRYVTSITTYTINDTLLQAGQIRSLFYFARRGIRSAEGDSVALVSFLRPKVSRNVRYEAALYLQRYPAETTSQQQAALRKLLRTEKNTEYLIAALNILGQRADGERLLWVTEQMSGATDWRVRVAAIKTLANYDYELVRDEVLTRLTDEHPLVRQQAADFFVLNGTAADASLYHRYARDSLNPKLRYTLYTAAYRLLPDKKAPLREVLRTELLSAYSIAKDPYERAVIISALSSDPRNYVELHNLYIKSTVPVVRSTAAEGLFDISTSSDFAAPFGDSAEDVRTTLAGYFKKMITSAEVGPAYYAANAIAADPLTFRAEYPTTRWISTALAGYELPRQIEAYYAVDAARAALEGQPAPTPITPPAGASPIDWQLLTQEDQTVDVYTSVGNFSLRLLPEMAPATASNFLRLTKRGYYDGRAFHRVVPGFVVQGGGPLGDGFGSEDYTVRTETPGIRWDRPGLVGMASAGKDTEGVQFFITHGPTPHLDGNYTIFGEVAEGQEIVDRITVGTTIDAITLR